MSDHNNPNVEYVIGLEDNAGNVWQDAMSADEYHNRVTRESHVDPQRAYQLVNEGLGLYPRNVDLLADAIAFAGANDRSSYLQSLFSIDRSEWTWRSFVFVIEYLTDFLADSARTEEEKWQALDNAEKVAREFVQQRPRDERSYRTLVKVLLKYGTEEKKSEAEEVLENVVVRNHIDLENQGSAFPVAQCAVTYADILLKDGRYEKVIQVASIGLAGSAQEQSTVRTGYLCYVRALAEDALLHIASTGEEGRGVFIRTNSNAICAMRDYRAAYDTLDVDSYRKTIVQRSSILARLMGIEPPLTDVEAK